MRPTYIYVLFILLLSCSGKNVELKEPLFNPFYEKAYEFLDKGLIDSSFYAFDQAKNVFVENNDSLNVANCLINMAITQRDQGDYFGAQETSLQAMDYLDLKNINHYTYLSTNYNILATATYNLKNYEQAIPYYNLAIEFSDNPTNTLSFRNNLAMAYHYIGDYEKAYEIFEKLIEDTHDYPKEYARVLSNFGKAKWEKDSSYNAVNELLIALKIREKEQDWRGLNASYSHLTDYYEYSNPDSALFYAKKQFDVSIKISNADAQIKGLYRLIKLSPIDSTKVFFGRYKNLKDSVEDNRTAAKNQFALIRYEVEKNKSENLRLEKENTEKAYRLTQQRVWTTSATVLSVVLLTGGIYWNRKRKQRLELEAQNKIKEGRLKTSKKVHDVVANGIYRVMSEIEYKEGLNREDILDKLEDMYHKSRDISYETEEPLKTNQAYDEKLKHLVKSFDTDFREVFIVGNESELWFTISDNSKEQILQVLQELLVNMDKHSQARNVVVRFEKGIDYLRVVYKDDGVGLQKETPYGNGLTNTVSRIEGVGGKIIFVNGMEKGLQIEMSIPVL